MTSSVTIISRRFFFFAMYWSCVLFFLRDTTSQLEPIYFSHMISTTGVETTGGQRPRNSNGSFPSGRSRSRRRYRWLPFG